ncbi:UNVERIFIED_CONTAM: protein DJ-1B [Sesamum latifolium]|uniref:Protein DJ-1B n=1 Tax=Sesamum latifolium TaxID=2727402 RepID=A0AAW2TR63_9LAMI
MASAAKKVLVPVANGTEPLEAVITIDVLRRAGADVTVASVEKQLGVDACHGVKIVADALISDCADTAFDLISLPGGMPGAATFKDCKTLESIVKTQAENDRPYAAICAAPAVALGSWGLLKGLKATCYPSFMDQLSSSASAVESRVQQDGKVVTSRGPGTAMEYAVALVELLYGKEKADEVLDLCGDWMARWNAQLFLEYAVAMWRNESYYRGKRAYVNVWFPANTMNMVMRSNQGDEYTFTELNPVKWTFDSSPQVDENVLSDHDYMDYVILVPIADGTEEMEAVIIIDVLRRAKAEVVVASVEDKLEILASRKVKLVADVLLDEAANRSYDLIVLPGGLGGAQTFANSEKLVNLLKKQRESNKLYGAICASPALVLEAHGLLKGKKATAFPAMCNKLSDPSEAENRVVVDGNLVTSRGPGTPWSFPLN